MNNLNFYSMLIFLSRFRTLSILVVYSDSPCVFFVFSYLYVRLFLLPLLVSCPSQALRTWSFVIVIMRYVIIIIINFNGKKWDECQGLHVSKASDYELDCVMFILTCNFFYFQYHIHEYKFYRFAINANLCTCICCLTSYKTLLFEYYSRVHTTTSLRQQSAVT